MRMTASLSDARNSYRPSAHRTGNNWSAERNLGRAMNFCQGQRRVVARKAGGGDRGRELVGGARNGVAASSASSQAKSSPLLIDYSAAQTRKYRCRRVDGGPSAGLPSASLPSAT